MSSTLNDSGERWIDWKKDIQPPQLTLPAGSVDAHCHVFGPSKQFPFSPDRRYTPTDASVEDLLTLHHTLGISRQVIVQASCHGTDNSALLHALELGGNNSRGIVSITPEISDEELNEMNEKGVRGVRFNFISRLVSPKPDQFYREILAKINGFNWHVVLYVTPEDLALRHDLISSITTPLLFDHMGRVDVSQGLTGSGFQSFLAFINKHDNAYIKLSGPERLSHNNTPSYEDVIPFARYFMENYSERVLWGTDWPHPNMKLESPDDAGLVDFIASYARDEQMRNLLLVHNPENLY